MGNPGIESIEVRLADPAADAESLVNLSQDVIVDGTTYVFERGATREDVLAYWFPEGASTFVAYDGMTPAGCYFIKANQPGRGAHLANASYLVASPHRGRGLGRHLALHSFDQALARGFTAMQFNMVVETNEGAIALWRSLGFETVGRIPGAFRHEHIGFVDVLVMHRTL